MHYGFSINRGTPLRGGDCHPPPLAGRMQWGGALKVFLKHRVRSGPACGPDPSRTANVKGKMVLQGKNWVFTLNNYSQVDVEKLRLLVPGGAVYLVFGYEVGESGTPHLQGYVQWVQKRRLSYCREVLPCAHWEVALGTELQASSYCKKDGKFEEFGRAVRKGQRTDLEDVVAAVKSGATLEQVAERFSGQAVRYWSNICRIKALYERVRDWESEVIVHWGPTGTGKTKTAIAEAVAYWIYPGGGWFDGYCEHDNAIFDDFTGSDFKLTYLLRLLDRYPMRVPVKGGFVQWSPRRVYITSNIDPRQWYAEADVRHQEALRRRIKLIKHFNDAL